MVCRRIHPNGLKPRSASVATIRNRTGHKRARLLLSVRDTRGYSCHRRRNGRVFHTPSQKGQGTSWADVQASTEEGPVETRKCCWFHTTLFQPPRGLRTQTHWILDY